MILLLEGCLRSEESSENRGVRGGEGRVEGEGGRAEAFEHRRSRSRDVKTRVGGDVADSI